MRSHLGGTIVALVTAGCGVTSYPGPASPTGQGGTFTFTFNQGELTERNGATFATADAATYCALVEDAGRTHAVLLDTWGYSFAILSVIAGGASAIVAGTAGDVVDPFEQAAMVGMPITSLLLAGIAYPFFRSSAEASRVAGRAGQGALAGLSPEEQARHCSQVVADYNDPRGTLERPPGPLAPADVPVPAAPVPSAPPPAEAPPPAVPAPLDPTPLPAPTDAEAPPPELVPPEAP